MKLLDKTFKKKTFFSTETETLEGFFFQLMKLPTALWYILQMLQLSVACCGILDSSNRGMFNTLFVQSL